MVNLANPPQFAKILPTKYIATFKISQDQNVLGVGVDVNLEVLRSCEAEARSPRSKLPINVLPIVNVKVAKPSMKPPKLRVHVTYPFLMSIRKLMNITISLLTTWTKFSLKSLLCIF